LCELAGGVEEEDPGAGSIMKNGVVATDPSRARKDKYFATYRG
jgi:hypothetical protein